MGLAASQARLLFITARTNQVEAGLMQISSKELRLKDEAADASARYNFNLRNTFLAFNGEAVSYDNLMGATAIENGVMNFITDKNNRVVLNNQYAKAAQAAGIDEKGNTTASAKVRAAFVQAMVGSPASANNWEEVASGKLSNTSAFKPIDNFKSVYGPAAPAQGVDYSKPIRETKTETVSYSMNDIINKMGNIDLNNISNLDGRSTKGSQKIYTIQNIGYNDKYSDIVKNNGIVELVNDDEKLSYDEIWSRAKAGFGRLADRIVADIQKAAPQIKNVASTLKPYVDTMKNQINGNLGRNSSGKESKAKNGAKDTATNGLIGVAVDSTATDQVWVYCNVGELTRRLLTALASNSNTATTGLQNSKVNANLPSTVSKTYTETVTTGYEPKRNAQGKSYEEWTAAWNKLIADNKYDEATAKQYLNNGSISVAPSSEDVATYNKYQALIEEIAKRGWTVDEDINKNGNLSEKLRNGTYKVNGESVRNNDDFEELKCVSQEIARQEYEKEDDRIEREEKALMMEKTNLQTELSALTSEKESVQNIINKNIERSFNLFG